MTTFSLKDIRANKSAVIREMTNMMDTRGANWTTEDQAAYNALNDKVELYDQQAKAFQNAIDLAAASAASAAALDNSARAHADASGKSLDEATHNVREAIRVFNKFAAFGAERLTPDEKRVMNIAESTSATYTALVPTIIMPNAIEQLKAYGGMREACAQISTANGNPIQWATYDDTAVVGEWLAENTAPAQAGSGSNNNDLLFGSVTIGANKAAAGPIPISFEIMQDSAVNVEAVLNHALMVRVGRLHNAGFTNGSGSGQPTGVVAAVTVGYTQGTGNTTSLSYNALVELEHSVDPAYRRNPGVRWMFNDTTLKVIKKLVDGNGRPLWLPTYGSALDTATDPGAIMGYRYTINQDMANLAANSKSVLFGDFSKYLIRDTMEMQLFRFTDSAYISKGQIGFMVHSRTDGKIIDSSTKAIRSLVQSAT